MLNVASVIFYLHDIFLWFVQSLVLIVVAAFVELIRFPSFNDFFSHLGFAFGMVSNVPAACMHISQYFVCVSVYFFIYSETFFRFHCRRNKALHRR